MKKILLIALLFSFALLSKAQKPLFLEGDKLVNLGLGLHSFSYQTVSASLDYGIVEDIADKGTIGVGPYVGLGFWSISTLYLHAGARGTFHYPIIDDLDTYAGFSMGIELGSNRYSAFRPGFFLGANYPVTDEILAFGEIGGGVSYLTIGITIRIN
jgi:hypothetical protein